MVAVEDVVKGNVEYDEADYIVKIRYDNNRRVFDVFMRTGSKVNLRWVGLSEKGLSELGELI